LGNREAVAAGVEPAAELEVQEPQEELAPRELAERKAALARAGLEPQQSAERKAARAQGGLERRQLVVRKVEQGRALVELFRRSRIPPLASA
jgi:hypothetical protein